MYQVYQKRCKTNLSPERFDGQGNIEVQICLCVLVTALQTLDVVLHLSLVENVYQFRLVSVGEILLERSEHHATQFLKLKSELKSIE